MCCFFVALVTLGPRFGILLWWLFDPARFQIVFQTWIWPLLGIIFLPWVTLMYVVVAPGGITGFDWVWLGLALVADIASWSGSAYKRKSVPGYPNSL
jgi:hypothetical protein